MSDHAGAVVVGYDSSPESQRAVDWAAREASRRQRTLVVLHAAAHVETVALAGAAGWWPDMATEAAHKVAEEGAERARRIAAEIDVEAVGDLKGAPRALQERSENASLVVVGNRGFGRLGGALLGSVAFAVSAHAASPVVVVRGEADQREDAEHPVVVGVDGSEHSDVALDRAADLAAETGAELRVVVAWEAPPAEPWSRAYLADVHRYEDAVGNAEQVASDVAQRAIERAVSRHPGLVVEQLVRTGRPEQVIAEASAGAGRLVVGARGRGDLASLLLGSVSRGVIHRAECPVEIIR